MLTPEQIQGLLELDAWIENSKLLVVQARAFTLEGYKAFYKLMHGFFPPQHIQDGVTEILRAYADDKGAEILMARGFWKTISFGVTFTTWFMGLFPTESNLWLTANDASGNDLSQAIADTIRFHPAFKSAFPHVVPDMERGWSQAGYEVKQTHTDASCQTKVEYSEWRKINSARRDPSLLALGYNSSSAIGKHPTGILGFDDIHDEKNTVSDLERKTVITKVRDVFLPMLVRNVNGKVLKTLPLVVGTPWTEDDAYAYLPSTGEFRLHTFPVMREVSPETPGAIYIQHASPVGEELKGWFLLSWPEQMGLANILSAFNLSGKRGFWRMYMLLLLANDAEGVRFLLYPASEIDITQDAAGGCDYASVEAERKKDVKNRSRFAHVYVVKIPRLNKLVVQDCFSEHVSQLDAERQLAKPQAMFPTWRGTWFESDGVGGEALQTFRRNPGLKIVPSPTKGIQKNRRQEIGVIPWLELGQVMISDADTPGLNLLRTSLKKFPNGTTDERDALFHALKAFPEVLSLQNMEEGAIFDRKRAASKTSNPWITSFQRT